MSLLGYRLYGGFGMNDAAHKRGILNVRVALSLEHENV